MDVENEDATSSFIRLRKVWDQARPAVEQQLRSIEHSPYLFLVKERVESFAQFMEARDEPEAAWQTLRLLIAELGGAVKAVGQKLDTSQLTFNSSFLAH
mmetsp:Transcript_2393/g.4960  ORF Transcript_2393/g.4960 Transcript_2393/m.4960 type:complete len:99 (-) Transcript_2393:373-669(-)